MAAELWELKGCPAIRRWTLTRPLRSLQQWSRRPRRTLALHPSLHLRPERGEHEHFRSESGCRISPRIPVWITTWTKPRCTYAWCSCWTSPTTASRSSSWNGRAHANGGNSCDGCSWGGKGWEIGGFSLRSSDWLFQDGYSAYGKPTLHQPGMKRNFLLVLNVGNGWVAWGCWDYEIDSYCGSFPHSLLSTSKFWTPFNLFLHFEFLCSHSPSSSRAIMPFSGTLPSFFEQTRPPKNKAWWDMFYYGTAVPVASSLTPPKLQSMQSSQQSHPPNIEHTP